jgi:hypothetical protein
MVGKVKVERRQRLLDICKHVVDNPHDVDGDTKAALKRATLKYAATQYVDTEQALKNLYQEESELGSLLRKAVEVVADHDASDDPIRAPVSDHHASTVADLLVEAGTFPHRAAALHHVLHSARGQALLTRMHKKESPMQDTVLTIIKDAGIAGVCAAIVAKGSTTISEHELVEAASKVAAERYPGLTEAQAFDKVYSDRGDEGRLLRSAVAIAKAMPFVADLTPLVVGGVDAMHAAVSDTESSEAYAQLQQIGRDKWPTLSEAQQFANAFTDPVNAELARKAHRRPTPPVGGAYPFPR